MTADDFGVVDQQLAQQWGVDRSVVNFITSAAMETYSNCSETNQVDGSPHWLSLDDLG